MLEEKGLTIADCDAVCVSKGPGSYTGLRVGVSTAKGLCFGSGKPLIAIGTLDILTAQAQEASSETGIADPSETVIADTSETDIADTSETVIADTSETVIADHSGTVIADLIGNPSHIVPMIDARRMEVYAATFKRTDAPTNHSEATPRYTQVTETAPAIIDETSYTDLLEQGPVLFIGDGAGKCADVIKHPNATFIQCWPKASAMLQPALRAYRERRFEDVAYFEPFYLKEFVATVSKKKLF
jgi:tRNA threonylcarbamoyladenosine biosynthesis protein TsaB